MRFQKSNPPRQAVIQFLKAQATGGQIVAPPTFSDVFSGRVQPYDAYRNYAKLTPDFDWAVLHKGQLSKLNVSLLLAIDAYLRPVFANEVFVVFAKSTKCKVVPYDSTHLVAFRQRRAEAIAHRLTQQAPLSGNQLTPKVLQQIHRAQSVYLGNRQALTHTSWGGKLIVNTDDISLSPHLLSEGKWEPWVTRVFQQEITPDMTVVDIGANIGYYTTLAASLTTQTGHVYGFEASPNLSRILWKNANINGMSDWVTIVNKAVYDSTTTLQFSQLESFQGSGSISAQGSLDREGQQRQQAYIQEQYRDNVTFYDVEAIALDDYFDSDTLVDFIKIDAEGSEPFIFEGMRQLIARQSQLKIVFEFYPQLFESANRNPRQFLESLQHDGFALQAISHREGAVTTSLDNLLSGQFQELLITKGYVG
ncbi:MAG: FkbM family methyltransferase [Elainellaceae cyanobacterium]